ncbi:MAG: hypothetical protein ACREA9_24555, partial [Pyrinomonadaceae bacterium]
MLTRCKCCNTCRVLSDNFSRSESLANVGVPPGDIFWSWLSGGTSPSSANGSEAEIPTASYLTLKPDLTTGGVSRQFKVSFRVKLGEDEVTFRLRYSLILNSVTENEIDLELVTSDGAGCGIMRLLLDSVAVTDDIPVVGLDADTWIDVTLCYSGEQGLLSVTVTPDGGEAQSCHAKDVATTSGTALNTSELTFTNVDSSEILYIDDVVLARTKTLEDGDYGDAEDCPCCGGGCSEESDSFPGASIADLDCRWDVYAASFTLSGGEISTIDDNTRMLRIPNGNGIDVDCLPDNSIWVSTEFYISGYVGGEGELIFIFDWSDSGNYHYVKITYPDDPGMSEAGTLKIFSSTGGELASGSIDPLEDGEPYTLTICYDGTTITATLTGFDPVEADDVPFGGGVYGV